MPPTASSSEKPPRLSAGSGVSTFLDQFYLVSNQSRRHFHRGNMRLCNTSTKLLICNMQFRHIAQIIDVSGKCQWHIRKPDNMYLHSWQMNSFYLWHLFCFVCAGNGVTTRQVLLNGVVLPSRASWAMEQLFHQLSTEAWGPFSFCMAQDTAYLQSRSATPMANLWHISWWKIPLFQAG